ncbi:MAG: four-carbon acid sugar kinase family protein [Bryobacteraceae bacterium]
MAAALPDGLLLTYYGDDFTGSTDVAEVLTFNGLPTLLYLGEGEIQRLKAPEGYRAVGVAGVSRSQSPAWMSGHLPGIFEHLRALGGRICHYKVCSTFDSSPEVGSIGKAIEIGREVFGRQWVPMVVGAPALDRYTVFGNLFASIREVTYRLDRHPVMSRHPVTPMDEADLREVLRRQADLRVELFDILALARPDYRERFEELAAADPDVVLFDTLDEQSLVRAGELSWNARGDGPFFAAASSGLQYAFVAYWRHAGLLPERPSIASVPALDRIVVVSGSCSAMTEAQIRYAIEHGYCGIRLDARELAESNGSAREAYTKTALGALKEGRSVVLYSALGPEDPCLTSKDAQISERLAIETGKILREILVQSDVRRTVVAGGDTSSHAGQQLGLYAVTPIRPAAPGSPLCRAWSDGPLDGLEVVFKGGQRGEADFFDKVRLGA